MTTTSPEAVVGEAPKTCSRSSAPVWLAVLVICVPAGLAAAWVVDRMGTGRLLTVLTIVTLCLPAVAAAGRLRRSPQAIVPLLAALGLLFFFGPRLLTFDPTSGLVSKIPMTPDEIAVGKTLTQVVLIAFALPIALVFYSVPIPRRRSDSAGQRRAGFRATLRLRSAVVLGALGALMTIGQGLAMGTRARNFESAGTTSPAIIILEFCAITVPTALWLAGYRRLSVVLLALSMAGPYLIGGRQDVLTPLIILLIAVTATSGAARIGRRTGSRKTALATLVVVTAVVVAVVGVAAATTARRATVDTAVNGGRAPSMLSTLVDDQTLLDPLLVAVAREPRPQGPEIYTRVLAAPIPRTIWPEKPFSYDYDFRQKYFPHYGDAIPISLVGTSFVTFLVPGVVLAGWLVALLALGAEALLGRRGQRSILIAAVLAIFIVDLIRIGGMYRELLTLTGSVIGVMLITRAAPPTLLRPGRLIGATHHV